MPEIIGSFAGSEGTREFAFQCAARVDTRMFDAIIRFEGELPTGETAGGDDVALSRRKQGFDPEGAPAISMTYVYERSARVPSVSRRDLGNTVAFPHSAGAGVHETAQLDTAPDYEFGGQEFGSLRARQLSHWFSMSFSFAFVPPPAPGCVRGEFSKLRMACSARPRVRAR